AGEGHLEVAEGWPVRLRRRRSVLDPDLHERRARRDGLDDPGRGIEGADGVHAVEFVAPPRVPEVAVVEHGIDGRRRVSRLYVPHELAADVEDRAEARGREAPMIEWKEAITRDTDRIERGVEHAL